VATTPGSIATRKYLTGREKARLETLAAKWRADPASPTPLELDKLVILLAAWGRVNSTDTYDGLDIEATITEIRGQLVTPPAPLTAVEREERWRRRQGINPMPTARHGTGGGYKRHLREETLPCPACLEDNADRSKVVEGTMTAEEAASREASRVAALGEDATEWEFGHELNQQRPVIDPAKWPQWFSDLVAAKAAPKSQDGDFDTAADRATVWEV
jgi:hypothetical protein